MWHVTGAEGEPFLKFQVPGFNRLGVMIFIRLGGKRSVTDIINKLKKKMFVEQPRLHRVC